MSYKLNQELQFPYGQWTLQVISRIDKDLEADPEADQVDSRCHTCVVETDISNEAAGVHVLPKTAECTM
jgi:hypothetical protein